MFKLVLSIIGSFVIAYLSISLFPSIEIKSMLNFYYLAIVASIVIGMFIGLPDQLIVFASCFYYWYKTGSFGSAVSFLLFTIVMGLIQLIIMRILNWLDYKVLRH
jgi:hypothetical protein